MSDVDYRLGRWQDVLADVECDALICDPPYGSRTHDGHNGVSQHRDQRRADYMVSSSFKNEIGYDHWTPDDVLEFVGHWAPRTRGWLVGMTSHDLIPAWESAFESAGRYPFVPIPYVHLSKAPRVVGDGPASWTVYVMASRPRSIEWLDAWRKERRSRGQSCSLPGAYLRRQGDVVWTPTGAGKRIGGKPLGLMREIVGDYSAPGDVVCDPFGGHATTLRAAIELGRRAVGCEVDEAVWADGLARLEQPVALDMFAERPMVEPVEQIGLGLE